MSLVSEAALTAKGPTKTSQQTIANRSSNESSPVSSLGLLLTLHALFAFAVCVYFVVYTKEQMGIFVKGFYRERGKRRPMKIEIQGNLTAYIHYPMLYCIT